MQVRVRCYRDHQKPLGNRLAVWMRSRTIGALQVTHSRVVYAAAIGACKAACQPANAEEAMKIYSDMQRCLLLQT